MSGGDLDQFLTDLSSNATTAPGAPILADAVNSLDVESDGNPNAAALYQVMSAICRTSAPLAAKLQMLREVLAIDGVVTVPRRSLINGG